MTRILVLCTGNSCRSQMAEGFLRTFNPEFDVHSAGTRPALRVHPMAIAVMKEEGIDISAGVPKDVARFIDQAFDVVMTVCDDAREACPLFSGKVRTRLHYGFEDPAIATGTDEEVLGEFRRIRDEIRSTLIRWYESTGGRISAEPSNPTRQRPG